MGAPYTSVTVSGYNTNPPVDDGTQSEANRVKWSTIKTKLPDPLKTAIEAVDANITTAVAKMVGGGGVTSTAIAYQIVSGDQGKLVKVTGSGSITVTTPDATDVGAPFVGAFLNNSTGAVTFDGSGAQTVNGAANLVVAAGSGFLYYTDGTNWFTTGQSGGAPTYQTFLSGSAATYTRPTGVVRIKVRMMGGGGGGGGGGAGAGSGGTGGTTSFSTFTAVGGSGGTAGAAGGAGGTGGTGSATLRLNGAAGIGSSGITGFNTPGSAGGSGVFGGGGSATPANTGGVGAANTGGGAGGGGISSGAASAAGAGAGSGEYVEFSIANPAATYTYTVGAGGTAGTLGTNGTAGGVGGTGVIVVEEFYS